MKKKRWSELIHETFVKENIVVDGVQRNLTIPEGEVGKAGMVIKEPEAGIFLYNGNFDMVFQKENYSQKYGRDVSKNGRALNVVILPPRDF
nr:hypothetical protein [Tanacetum cinerariifolium]